MATNEEAILALELIIAEDRDAELGALAFFNFRRCSNLPQPHNVP